MKLFLIGTLLFSGGSAAAMQNETVREEVKGVYQQVRQRMQKRVKENMVENVKENGFPYPSEERLANLTEEQQVALLTTIDQINAEYNWAEMTDEEIQEALLVAKDLIDEVALEFGFEHVPSEVAKRQFKQRVRRRTREMVKDHLLENLQENGIEYPSDERLANLTEEQAAAVIAQIDEFNATYDWATMTEDEIFAAIEVVKVEMQELAEELGLQFPYRNNDDCPMDDDDEEVDTDPVV